MEWLELLPPELAESAYRVNEEMAWSRADATRLVEILRANGYVVLGVDIWLPTRPGPTIPTPFVYDWSLRADCPEGYAKTADEFIGNFRWADADKSHRGMEPYFNITARRCES